MAGEAISAKTHTSAKKSTLREFPLAEPDAEREQFVPTVVRITMLRIIDKPLFGELVSGGSRIDCAVLD
jgi:hypothetical protein